MTSTTDSEKIKETLRKFVDHKLYEQYSHLQIYILTEKQKSYTGKGFDEIIGGRFNFNPKEDILDYRDVLGIIGGFPIESSEKILSILENNINSQSFASSPQRPSVDTNKTEIVTLNLLEVFFPDTLYVAELLPDISKQVSQTYDNKPYRGRNAKRHSKRDLVREALSQMGEKFAVDWEVHENKLISFHDLRRDIAYSEIDRCRCGRVNCIGGFLFAGCKSGKRVQIPAQKVFTAVPLSSTRFMAE